MSAEENATLLERTAPHITVPSHIVWGQEDQVRFNIIAEGRGFDLYICVFTVRNLKKNPSNSIHWYTPNLFKLA